MYVYVGAHTCICAHTYIYARAYLYTLRHDYIRMYAYIQYISVSLSNTGDYVFPARPHPRRKNTCETRQFGPPNFSIQPATSKLSAGRPRPLLRAPHDPSEGTFAATALPARPPPCPCPIFASDDACCEYPASPIPFPRPSASSLLPDWLLLAARPPSHPDAALCQALFANAVLLFCQCAPVPVPSALAQNAAAM